MSISSTGIFFYGLLWKENEKPWREPSKEELRACGVGEDDAHCVDWEDLYELRSKKKVGTCLVTCWIHCSFEYSMHLVAIKHTLVQADRGHPEIVKNLVIEPKWEGQLREFCEIMGIPWQEPAWWLTSLYG